MRVIYFLCFFLFSCSTVHRAEQAVIRHLVLEGKRDDAITFLDKTEFKNQSHNKLLYFLEKSILEHDVGHYALSNDYLYQARQFLNEHQKSISKSIASVVGSEYAKDYIGTSIERSIIPFYTALNFLELAMASDISFSEKRAKLFSARAAVLEWDIFFKNLKEEEKETLFQSDLLVKIFGAQVHEIIGDNTEKMIALDLYKDTWKLLSQYVYLFQSYNENFEECVKKSASKCNSKTTLHYQKLKDFVQGQITGLSHQLNRPLDIKFEKKLEASDVGNKKILLQVDLLSPMQAVSHYYPILTTYMPVGPNRYFAHQTLGLSYYNDPYYNNPYWFGTPTFAVSTGTLAVSFEIPKFIHEPVKRFPEKIIFKDSSAKILSEASLVLAGPLEDFYQLNFQEKMKGLYPKIVTQLITKYASAITSALVVYNSFTSKNKNQMGQDFFARLAAQASFWGVVKGFEAFQKADTRYLSTLPKNIYLTSTSISPSTTNATVLWSDGTETLLFQGDSNYFSRDFFSWQIFSSK